MNKEDLLTNRSNESFMHFLQNDHEGKILSLLDAKGLNLLKNNPYKEDKIRYILTYSNYKDELFKNSSFMEMFLNSNISDYYASLRHLNNETYDLILDTYFNTPVFELSLFAELFSYFNKDYKLSKLDNWKYGTDILYSVVNKDEVEVINKVINNYNIDLSDKRINIELLISLSKQSILKDQEERNLHGTSIPTINLPVELMNKDLAERLYNSYNIFQVRKMLCDLEWCTNIDEITKYLKNKENSFINNATSDTLISPYQEYFELFTSMKEAYETENYDLFYSIKSKYNELVRSSKIKYVNEALEEAYSKENKEGVYEYLKVLQNRELSNYIIDYHFEENYHNVIIDIKELLRYSKEGTTNIDERHLYLYEQIVNIDKLSIESKKALHEYLKNINIKEIFYDDMKEARYAVNSALKSQSLNRKMMEKFKDEELSKKYGVDIFNIDNKPFFGIVKTGEHPKDDLPTGHSYSLVGTNGVAVFGGSESSSTYLYDSGDLNPDQIVHVFPYDSFTIFQPFNAIDKPTERVNMLMTPEDITGFAPYAYTELLILEKGKKSTDIDKDIPELKKIALYCIDEVKEEDIDQAKKLGLGIVLVSSKNYIENKEYYDEKYKDIDNLYSYSYLTNQYDLEQFESTR